MAVVHTRIEREKIMLYRDNIAMEVRGNLILYTEEVRRNREIGVDYRNCC